MSRVAFTDAAGTISQLQLLLCLQGAVNCTWKRKAGVNSNILLFEQGV